VSKAKDKRALSWHYRSSGNAKKANEQQQMSDTYSSVANVYKGLYESTKREADALKKEENSNKSSNSCSNGNSVGATSSAITTTSYDGKVYFDPLNIGIVTVKATTSTQTTTTTGNGGSSYTIDAYSNTNATNGSVKFGVRDRNSNGVGSNIYVEWLGFGFSESYSQGDVSSSAGFNMDIFGQTGFNYANSQKINETTSQTTTYSASVNTGVAAIVVLSFVLGPEVAEKLSRAFAY